MLNHTVLGFFYEFYLKYLPNSRSFFVQSMQMISILSYFIEVILLRIFLYWPVTGSKFDWHQEISINKPKKINMKELRSSSGLFTIASVFLIRFAD